MAKADDTLKRIRNIGIRLDKAQQRQLRRMSDLETEFFTRLIDRLLADVRTDGNGRIVRQNRIKLTKLVDDVLKEMKASGLGRITEAAVKDMEQLLNDRRGYYKPFAKTSKRQYTAITRSVNRELRKWLGFTQQGNLVPRGYLDKLVTDPKFGNDVKQIISKAVIGGKPVAKLHKELRQNILSREDAPGLFRRHAGTLVHDAYAQFDRITNDEFRKRLKLQFGMYAGGLRETSRKFCIDRNGKIYHRSELKKFSEDKNLPLTKEEKEAGGPIGYDAAKDCGRFNCVHAFNWMSREIAAALGKKVSDFPKAA